MAGRSGWVVVGLVAGVGLGALAWWVRPPPEAPEAAEASRPRRVPCSDAGRQSALRRARDLVGRVPAGLHGVWVAEPVLVAPASLADAPDDVEALGIRFTFAQTDGRPDGIDVRLVEPGSRAEMLGLRVDDVVRAIDGRPLRSFGDVTAAVAGWHETGVSCVQITRRGQARIFWVVRESEGRTP